MSPWRRSRALFFAVQPPAAAVGTVDGRAGRTNLDRGPDAVETGRGDHSPLLGRDAFGECRAPCGRRRRCRSPCRSSMMSNRPAEHSDGDRSTRNAAFGAESARIWSISGRNHLSHAESAPHGHSDAFANSSDIVEAFDDVQPVASDHSHTAARVLGVGARRRLRRARGAARRAGGRHDAPRAATGDGSSPSGARAGAAGPERADPPAVASRRKAVAKRVVLGELDADFDAATSAGRLGDFYRPVEPLAAPARGRAGAQRPKSPNFWRVFYRSAEECRRDLLH